jgi:16S rRNA pseudouridine516 synthase
VATSEVGVLRLDRYVSQATGLSRSQARSAIRAGRVGLADQVVTRTSYIVGEQPVVSLDGVPVSLPGRCYYMLNKPKGYVCDRGNAHHPSVFELLGPGCDLHVAGRLDADVTGLVLITDDGDWSHALTAPRRKQSKTYLATLAEPICTADAEALRAGVRLHGETRPTRPAAVEVLPGGCRVRLTIAEGRYHQVKRMFAAVGNRVESLHRERIGPFVLDPHLGPGDYRALDAGEVAQVQTPGRKL